MLGGNFGKCHSEKMHRLLRVRGPVSLRRDSTNFGSHPPKQCAEELVVKPGVWVDGDLCDVSQYSIMNTSAVRSPVTNASSTIDAYCSAARTNVVLRIVMSTITVV
jgi:hypothetical protein